VDLRLIVVCPSTVALTTQCAYCLEIHRKSALEAGATDEQLAEVTFIAAALRAGGAITHGTHLIED
jgi:AhpD family alkylhydroperoxidase